MSILFMDNFSNYGSSTTGRGHMLEGVYADASSQPIPIADPDGVSGDWRKGTASVAAREGTTKAFIVPERLPSRRAMT